MPAKFKDPIPWNDDNFQRIINEDNYYHNKRILLSQKYKDIEKCIWCGQKFIKNHHSEKYCCDECRTDARRQQLRNRSHRWYHRHNVGVLVQGLLVNICMMISKKNKM